MRFARRVEKPPYSGARGQHPALPLLGEFGWRTLARSDRAESWEILRPENGTYLDNRHQPTKLRETTSLGRSWKRTFLDPTIRHQTTAHSTPGVANERPEHPA
jgi:hypothetical protein